MSFNFQISTLRTRLFLGGVHCMYSVFSILIKYNNNVKYIKIINIKNDILVNFILLCLACLLLIKQCT